MLRFWNEAVRAGLGGLLLQVFASNAVSLAWHVWV